MGGGPSRPASVLMATLVVSSTQPCSPCIARTCFQILQGHHLVLIIRLVPGDSGAWVFDKSTGRVCGHVLAWSEKSRTAYIAPMQVLLEDIARTLGATKVTLPGSSEDTTTVPRPTQRQEPRTRPDQLSVELGRLSLGSRMSGGRGFNVYRPGPPMLTQPRGLERQLA
jgi:hypothetical protein